MTRALFRTDVAGQFPDYLRDESRRSGQADSLSFAHSAEDIATVLKTGEAVTIQGSRTGVTGGAVPDGGGILNLSRMAAVTALRYDAERDECRVTVQPGLTLVEFRRLLQGACFDTTGWSAESVAALALFRSRGPFFFPPDPTETSASLGGMVACNASGACTFRYGPTRAYVESLGVTLADGSTVSLRRGRDRVRQRCFSLTTEQGRVLSGQVPRYAMPAVKNASGYYTGDEMDLIDLFIGSEGTLGVFHELELRVIRQPAQRCGIMVFMPDEASALRLVESLRCQGEATRPAALEFFDSQALALLRRHRHEHAGISALPEMPERYHTALYLEFHGSSEAVMEAVEGVPEAVERSGGDADAAWMADTEHDLERFKLFRHAVPELVNRLIDVRRRTAPGVTKLGTDMAVPDACLGEVMGVYHQGLEAARLEYVIFGHIGNNHLHVNILPRDQEDYNRGKDLYLQWARRVIGMGGTVSAEHGIGKFKVALLREMLGEEGIRQMREVKRCLDPAGQLNRGNLFL